MRILLNDRVEEFRVEKLSVTDMLQQKKFSFRLRVIKVNGTLVPADAYDSTFIKEGDKVQMLYLMSGG
jgi:thiamine biosynthesis protein ThiS